MMPRRFIGSLLVMALAAGPALVPLARAACAVPAAKAACPSCLSLRASEGPMLSMDRSCCAAPSSVSERDPATFASARSAEQRAFAAVVIVPTVPVLAAAPERVVGIASDPPSSSPPLLRTTILLI